MRKKRRSKWVVRKRWKRSYARLAITWEKSTASSDSQIGWSRLLIKCCQRKPVCIWVKQSLLFLNFQTRLIWSQFCSGYQICLKCPDAAKKTLDLAFQTIFKNEGNSLTRMSLREPHLIKITPSFHLRTNNLTIKLTTIITQCQTSLFMATVSN